MSNFLNRSLATIKSAWVAASALVASAFYTGVATAQLAAPSSMGLEDAIVGDDTTAGSETGLLEIVTAVTAALPVILGIVIIVVGFMIAKKFFRRASSSA